MNKNIDVGSVNKYIDEQAKEKSERWAERYVDKIHLEATLEEKTFPESMIKNYEKVEKMAKGKKEEDLKKIFANLPKELAEDYKKVGGQKEALERIIFAIDGMSDLEKFLDVLSEIKKDLKE